MLRGNPQIDLLLSYTPEGLEPLRIQEFDLVLCLDKTPRAAAVGAWAKAPEKLGFGLTRYGTVYPLNSGSEYAFVLGLDDDLKFRQNTKTYQQVIFECAGLSYNDEEYCLEIDDDDRRAAVEMLAQRGIAQGDVVIGLNPGGGSAFAHKMWNAAGAIRFLRLLQEQVQCKVLLFGAEPERKAIDAITKAGLPDVFETITTHSGRVFQALLGRCAVVVTGDSLGMHLAIAEKRQVVVLFGPTCPQEIELYGRGEKIISPLDCAPCYRSCCVQSPTCMAAIEPGPVVAAVKRLL
jgi:heptosyltransferase-2